jgi:DnaJ-class molecular chaperone
VAAEGTDHYAVLQVAPQACSQVIDAAFVVLREMELVGGGPDAHRRLVALNRAHHVLSDPERRAAYDATLAGTGLHTGA